MHGARLDSIVRSLGGVRSRRGVLGGALGLGAALAGRGGATAACPPDQVERRGLGCVCRTTGRPPVDGLCPCRGGLTRCGAACVNTATDPAHCGGCGRSCGGDACVRGELCAASFVGPGATGLWAAPQTGANVTIETLGAQGGSGYPPGLGGAGGLGGRVVATLAVGPGQQLLVTPGGAGNAGVDTGGGGGGSNGGGPAGAFGAGGGGGGGASDVRVGGFSLAERAVVAGGGGGGGGAFGGADVPLSINTANGGGGGGGGSSFVGNGAALVEVQAAANAGAGAIYLMYTPVP
jgi:hypothetical protein